MLNLRSNAAQNMKLRKLLEKNHIVDNVTNSFNILFSDIIYRISPKQERQKRILIISEENLYILKNFNSLQCCQNLSKLKKISISTS